MKKLLRLGTTIAGVHQQIGFLEYTKHFGSSLKKAAVSCRNAWCIQEIQLASEVQR